MRSLALTAEDMADLIAGGTINAMIEGGEEIALSAPDGVNKDWTGVRGCSCGMADYGAPGHDGAPDDDEDPHDDDGNRLTPEWRADPGTCLYCHLPVHLGDEGLLVDERTGDWWCRANPSNGGDAAPHEVTR